MNPIDAVNAASPLPSATPTPPTEASGSDAGFAASLAGAVDDLSAVQSRSDALKVAAVTGDLDDIHSAMIAATRASVTLELVTAVRNKGIEAFNDILRMQA